MFDYFAKIHQLIANIHHSDVTGKTESIIVEIDKFIDAVDKILNGKPKKAAKK
jgi:hypothetical protein